MSKSLRVKTLSDAGAAARAGSPEVGSAPPLGRIALELLGLAGAVVIALLVLSQLG